MNEKIAELERRWAELTQELAEARRTAEPEPVDDYTLHSDDGPVTLSQLFGDRDELLVIHNMGKSCPYCTLWADGFNGVLGHLEDRAAVVLVSPDPPHVQREFAASRGWRFRMVSYGESSFAHDMGFESEPGQFGPGVSAFRRRDDGTIVRTGRAEFGPGDPFCPVWHLFDLFGSTHGDWSPKYAYPEPARATR